jgi:hypothetical protein
MGMYFYKLNLPEQKFTVPKKNTGIIFLWQLHEISVLCVDILLKMFVCLSLRELTIVWIDLIWYVRSMKKHYPEFLHARWACTFAIFTCPFPILPGLGRQATGIVENCPKWFLSHIRALLFFFQKLVLKAQLECCPFANIIWFFFCCTCKLD